MAASLYTLAQLTAAIYTRLEDNNVLWTQPEVTAVINEAIRVTNAMCGFYQGTVRLISQAGQLVYSTPAGMLYPQRVQFEGIQLDPVPFTRIGQDYRTWATDTTSKLGAVARWVPIGINYFCLHPADSLGGGDIEVTGVLETPLLVAPTDSMVLDDQYANIVIEYGFQRLPLKIGGPSFAAASQSYTKSFIPSMKGLTNLQSMKFPRYFVMGGSPVAEGRTS